MHFLYFSALILYNYHMKNINYLQTGSSETVTISKAEYEEIRAQSKHVSELECHVERLMETLSLAQHKHFCVSSEKVGICSAGN